MQIIKLFILIYINIATIDVIVFKLPAARAYTLTKSILQATTLETHCEINSKN